MEKTMKAGAAEMEGGDGGMWRPWVIAPFEADTAMALSLGSGWHASSAPGTDHC
jgi:hypothetical protein